MWGIELKWFLLLLVIGLTGGGIASMLKKVNKTLEWGFNETWGKFNLIEKLYPAAVDRSTSGDEWMAESERDKYPLPSMYSIEDRLSDIADAVGVYDEYVVVESFNRIQNTLEEIRDALVKK
jgi:hypothetical protein